MSALTRLLSVVHGMTFDDYIKRAGISITGLKHMRRSPLHYRHAMANRSDTAPMSLGRAAHCAVLEPERFEIDFVVWDRTTASGSSAPRNGQHWEKFKADNTGKEIVTADQMAEAVGMRDAVRGCSEAMKYLASGSPEVSIFWQMMGHSCRGRIDWLTEIDGEHVLVGLKSARDCRLYQFGKQAANLAYHLQWAYYFDGWKAITGKAPRMVEIVVEAKPPHAVTVYQIPDDVLQQGTEEYLELLEQLAECQRTNRWPGPSPVEQIMVLPSWVYGEELEIEYAE